MQGYKDLYLFHIGLYISSVAVKKYRSWDIKPYIVREGGF
jgi:hypothetical protein